MLDKKNLSHPVPRSSLLLAGLGFLLAALMLALFLSSQLAVLEAQNYLRKHYQIDADLPVKGIRPTLVQEPLASNRPMPPLGFCWAIEVDADFIQAELSVNPWTREVIDWEIEI